MQSAIALILNLWLDEGLRLRKGYEWIAEINTAVVMNLNI
jgi:hypothetical protein